MNKPVNKLKFLGRIPSKEEKKAKEPFFFFDRGGDIHSYKKMLKLLGAEEIKFNTETKKPKLCTCASRDLFHFGCRCGGL